MAVDAFLKIDGVPGESTAAGHEGEIDLDSFSWGASNPTTIGSATGGAGAGKVNFKELVVTKHVDKASAKLFLHCCNGVHFPEATITVRKAGGDGGGSGRDYLVYTFDTVFVTSIDWAGPGDEGPEESVAFVFGQIDIKYTAPDASISEVTWDVVQNRGG